MTYDKELLFVSLHKSLGHRKSWQCWHALPFHECLHHFQALDLNIFGIFLAQSVQLINGVGNTTHGIYIIYLGFAIEHDLIYAVDKVLQLQLFSRLVVGIRQPHPRLLLCAHARLPLLVEGFNFIVGTSKFSV